MISSIRKGQSSFEFVAIAGVMFLIFIGMFLVIQSRISSTRTDQVHENLDHFSNLLETEIYLAKQSSADYSREFWLPTAINGFSYDVNITGPAEISVGIVDSEYVIFLNYNLSDGATIGPGKNLITQVDGEVNISSV